MNLIKRIPESAGGCFTLQIMEVDMARFDLTDFEWPVIQALAAEPAARRRAAEDRRV